MISFSAHPSADPKQLGTYPIQSVSSAFFSLSPIFEQRSQRTAELDHEPPPGLLIQLRQAVKLAGAGCYWVV